MITLSQLPLPKEKTNKHVFVFVNENKLLFLLCNMGFSNNQVMMGILIFRSSNTVKLSKCFKEHARFSFGNSLTVTLTVPTNKCIIVYAMYYIKKGIKKPYMYHVITSIILRCCWHHHSKKHKIVPKKNFNLII